MGHRVQRGVPTMTGTQQETGDELLRGELVHSLFRGSGELSKLHRFVATIFEVAAALGAFGALVAGTGWSAARYWPLIAATLILASKGLRIRARRIRSFSDRCRQRSIEAFASGNDVEARLCADLKADAPTGASWMAARLPGKSMTEYYEPSFPPGVDRYREAYAHSSHFTWQLLDKAALVHWVVAIVLLATTIGSLYLLGTWHAPHEARLSLLDFVATFVLAALFTRAFDAALAGTRASREIRRLHDELMEAPRDAAAITRFAHEHDLTRESQPHVPSWAYRLLRGRVAKTWAIAREALLKT